MGRILNFQKKDGVQAVAAPAPAPAPVDGLSFGDRLMRGVWIGFVLLWPFLKWVVSIDVFIQFILMFARWDTAGSYAGWNFLAHFAVLVACNYYVGVYRPKGF